MGENSDPSSVSLVLVLSSEGFFVQLRIALTALDSTLMSLVQNISKKIPSVHSVVAIIDAKTYSVVKKETEENGVGGLTWVIVVVDDDIGETLEGRSTRETSEETSSQDGSQLSSEDG